jgi:hypothetical protein
MATRALSTRAARWMSRGLRITLAGTVIVVAFGAVAVRVSVARASDVGMSFGDQLLLVGESQTSGSLVADVYHVRVNGQTLETTNTTTDLPMREVLNYAADQCKNHADGLRDAFQHLDETLATKEPTSGTSGALIVHQEYGERGYVFCVAPDHALNPVELMGRLEEAGHTGDFSRIGNMRYIAVRQMGPRARVVTAWHDGQFELAKMFPATEDAPGDDFGGVPRPDGARRTLSATVDGAPAGVNSYEVKGTANDILTSLDGKLVAKGWKVVPTAPGVPNAGKYYTLGTKEDLVVTASDGTAGMTNVAYVVSRNVGSVAR